VLSADLAVQQFGLSVMPGYVTGAAHLRVLCRKSPPGPAGQRRCHDGPMTVIKINAITVPENSGDELARRFGARAGAVDDQDGFEGFELLKPTDDRTTWLVVTRWRDEAAFDAWVTSPAFAHGHRSARASKTSGSSGEGAAGGGAEGEQSAGPVGIHSELWSYEIAGGSAGKRS
jgi:heme oxygenase (mycobilin-producing)